MRTGWIKRWKKQIFCVIGSILILAVAVYGEKTGNSLNRGYLERGSYGEDSKVYKLLVEGISEKPIPVTAEVSPIQYSQQEAEMVFTQLYSHLPELILAENDNLEHITTDLNLVDLFDDQGVRAVWQSRNPKVIDSYGHITAENIPQEGLLAVLEVILTDGRYEKRGEIELRICPLYLSEQETLITILTEQMRQADLENPTSYQVLLPEEYEGKSISYRDSEASDYWILPLLGIILAVLLYEQEKSKEEQKKKKRKQLLKMDYADVVYQLMVYIGAGLTVGKAWEYMVQNYEKEQKSRPDYIRPAYEEMVVTLNQIKYGISEGKAIDEFGKRCQVQSYLKLSSLLEQNRKTGTKNLTHLLEQEMADAWEEQKHLAKRMGEEAGTKLLIPLFLMLLVVMVIIMVPAMMAMQG